MTADPQLIVLFGATGDLAKRKLLPGLLHLLDCGLIPDLRLIGVARSELDDDGFRDLAEKACREFSKRPIDDAALRSFLQRLSYISIGAGADARIVSPSSTPPFTIIWVPSVDPVSIGFSSPFGARTKRFLPLEETAASGTRSTSFCSEVTISTSALMPDRRSWACSSMTFTSTSNVTTLDVSTPSGLTRSMTPEKTRSG
jgi:hypothetical protein